MPKLHNRREVIAAGLALAIGRTAMSRSKAAQNWSGKKVLVAHYSRTGHTRTVAEMIQSRTGGDLIEIQTVKPYPDDYDALVAQNVAEQEANFLPALRTRIDNIGDYDVVFIGSPLWNVRLTPPVRSFVSSLDLNGAVVAPFVTYIVSRLGRARQDIGELASRADVLDGLAVLGEDAGQAGSVVERWLANLKINS